MSREEIRRLQILAGILKEGRDFSLDELESTNHFEQRVGERGDILDITNLNNIPLKDYNVKEVKEKLKANIATELKRRVKDLLSKDFANSQVLNLGVKLLKPVLVVDTKKYPLRLFAISTKEVKNKDGSKDIIKVNTHGIMYFVTISDDKATTILLLDKEDDNELYFQIRQHIEKKSGKHQLVFRKDTQIIEYQNYIYKIDIDELMGNKKEKEVATIDPDTLPYKIKTDYRKDAKFEHEKYGEGVIVATSAGSRGTGDSRGIVDWIDVQYPKPFLKGGKLEDVRRFEKIYTLASPLIIKK